MRSEQKGESDKRSAAEEAADWLLHLQESLDDIGLQGDFHAWLERAPENRRAWENTRRAWHVLGHVPPACEHVWRGAGLDTRRRDGGKPASARPGRAGRWRRVKVGLAAAAVGLAACVAVMAGPILLLRLQADHYTTTAQNRIVTLDDGSTVTLAAASAIKADFRPAERHVTVLAGEAFFEVRHDAARPFVVDTGDVRVSVLGTAFDVRVGSEATAISLLNGAVEATAKTAGGRAGQTLSPGDLLVVDRSSGTMRAERIALEDIAGWREGRLFVIDTPIGAVVEQIQRYHPAWIAIPDRELAGYHVTGFYDLTDPDRALRALVEPFGGRVREISSLVRVIARP